MSMYDNLNSMQQEAVFHTEGPVLIEKYFEYRRYTGHSESHY